MIKTSPMTRLSHGSIISIVILLGSCQKADTDLYEPSFIDKTTEQSHLYTIGVHPLHNPQRLHQVFSPLAQVLGAHIPGAEFQIEASRDYAMFNRKLEAKVFDFAIPNPYQTLHALSMGYQVIAKMANDEKFRGIILVRNDSGITQLSDLRDKRISFPAPTALAATIMPQNLLHTGGLDIHHDITSVYVGSQESSIMSVFLGEVAAGATWPQPWNRLKLERPELSAALTVKWQTDSLPNNSVIVRNDIELGLINSVRNVMVDLHLNRRGIEILKAMDLDAFEPATNESYDTVKTFLYEFSRSVRPLELDGI